MNIIIKPDHFDAPTREFLRTRIFTSYYEIYPIARWAYGIEDDPWQTYRGTLEVTFHPAGFDGHSGLTHWFSPHQDSKMEIAWDTEWGGIIGETTHHPMRHEFGHWIGLQYGHAGWGDFGHGNEADPLMRKVKDIVLTGYNGNYLVEHAH